MLDSAPEEAIPQTFTLKQIRPVRERIPNKNRHDEKPVRESQNKQENGEKTEK